MHTIRFAPYLIGLSLLVPPALQSRQNALLDLSPEAVETWLNDVRETGPERSGDLIIANTNVVDVINGSILASQSLLIEDGIISRIENSPDGLRLPGIEMIDGRGLYLLSGLVDSHVHLANFMLEVTPLFTAFGVTSIINLSGSAGHLLLADRLAEEPVGAPHPHTTGPFIQTEGPLTGDAACQIARDHRSAGFAGLKFYQEDMPDSDFRQFLVCARALDIPVFGHLPDGGSVEAVLGTGLVIAHAEELLDTRWRGQSGWMADPDIREDVARTLARSDVSLIPNLALYSGIIDMIDDELYARMLEVPEMSLMPEIIQNLYGPANHYRPGNHPEHESGPAENRTARMRGLYRRLESFTLAFASAGGRILIGSDAPNPMAIYGVSLHREIAALSEAGLSNLQILRAATIAPGEVMPAIANGRIAVGAPADLVLSRENPLDKIDTLSKPAIVIVGGRAYSSDDLIAIVRRSAEGRKIKNQFSRNDP